MAGADETRRLLRQCASSLLSACHRLESRETESSAAHLQSSNATTPNSTQTNLNATTTNRPPANASQTSLQEHMALFNFKPSSGQKSFAHSGKRKRAGSVPGRNKAPYYVRNTWTHVFVCLSSTTADRIPDPHEKIELALAGLGEKKVEFDKNGDSNHVHEKLMKEFAKLGDGGGYEIMRSTNRKGSLSVIPMSAVGYPVSYLQGVLSQAKAYIRPMQRDLPLDAATLETTSASSPTVHCLNCGVEVEMTKLKHHQNSCAGGSSSMNSEEDIEEITEEVIIDFSKTPRAKDSQRDVHVNALQQIFTLSEKDQIIAALQSTDYDVAKAAELLAQENKSEDFDDEYQDFPVHVPDLIWGDCSSEELPPVTALEKFCKTVKRGSSPPSRIYLSRLHGDLENDILQLYKASNFSLTAEPKVRFKGEAGVGSGPVREFFSLSMQLLEEGLPDVFEPDKRLLIFEGQEDHKVPRQEPLLRQTGLFVAAGKMIAHAALHGGPGIHGISPAVVHYWSVEDVSVEELAGNRPPVGLEDIPDVHLREILNELLELKRGDAVPDQLKNDMSEYLTEANLPPPTAQNVRLVSDALILYNVIEKRRGELDDLAKGMESIGLINYLSKHRQIGSLLFPRTTEKTVDVQTVKARIREEGELDTSEQQAKSFLLQYIDELGRRDPKQHRGAIIQDLLAFWTSSPKIPAAHEGLTLHFADNAGTFPFPVANTCFRQLTIPVRYKIYADFAAKMDVALKFGSKGFSEV